MKQKIATQIDGVFTQVEDILDGLDFYEGDITPTYVTQAILRDRLTAAEMAVRNYGESRAAKKAAIAAQGVADEAVTAFLRSARHVLVLKFGGSFSEDWIPTGFPNQSTAIPRTIGNRQALARALQNYFANHAALEHVGLGVTAVQAGVVFNGLSATRSAVNNAYDQTSAAKTARDAAVNQLTSAMRRLIRELGELLADDDSRWYSFGLNPPAAPETPEAVDGLELHSSGAGTVVATWTNPPRADRYRVLKQVVGVDAELVAVETVYDTQFAFTGLTAGKTLRVQIVPVNEAGTGEPSETMEIVIA
jgi:hypothetical protein